ncbi:MAG: protein kinase [Planctomycetota bacterium]
MEPPADGAHGPGETHRLGPPRAPSGRLGGQGGGQGSGRSTGRRAQRLGPYLVEGTLGRGAMGEVYRVRHVDLDASFALKVLGGQFGADEEAITRFEREVKLLAQLDHPGIVRVHHAGRAPDGRPYCVMDLVEGPTLAQALARGLDEERALDRIAEVAQALGHAHRQGLVHRDVKPENVLLETRREAPGLEELDASGGPSAARRARQPNVLIEEATQRARLTDFGLAKLLGPRALDLTRSNVAVGTPRYMAPEQVRDRERVGPWTDVFALGAMVYEVFCRRTPYERATTLEIFDQLQRASGPPAFESGRPEVDRCFGPLLARALDPDVTRRPQDGAEFAEALAAARRGPVEAGAGRGGSVLRAAVLLGALALAFGAGRLGRPESRAAAAPSGGQPGDQPGRAAGSSRVPAPAASGLAAPGPGPGATAAPDVSPAPGAAPRPAPAAWAWTSGQRRRYELQVETELSRAQPPALQVAATLSTGLDGEGKPLATGAPDPRWLLVSTPEGPVTPPRPLQVAKANAPWTRRHTGRERLRQWLTIPNGEVAAAPGRYRVRLSFALPAGFAAETAVFQALLEPDDFVRAATLDGQPLPALGAQRPALAPVQVSRQIALQPGEHTFELELENAVQGPVGLAAYLRVYAQPRDDGARRLRWEGLRSFELVATAEQATPERARLRLELAGLRVRRTTNFGGEDEQRLFDSHRDERPDEAFRAAIGRTFQLELDPRSGAVLAQEGIALVQAAIDAQAEGFHGPTSGCLEHALPELIDGGRMRRTLEAVFAFQPPPGGVATWRRAHPPCWLPVNLVRTEVPLTFQRAGDEVRWEGQAPVQTDLDGDTFVGTVKVEGSGRLVPGPEGALATCQERLEGKVADEDDDEEDPQVLPLEARVRTTLRLLRE